MSSNDIIGDKFVAEVAFINDLDQDVVCIFVDDDKKLSDMAKELDQQHGNIISKALSYVTDDDKIVKTAFGESKTFVVACEDKVHNIVVVGLGKQDKLRGEKLGVSKFEKLGGAVANIAKAFAKESVSVDLSSFSVNEGLAICAGIQSGSYNFDKYRTEIIIDGKEEDKKQAKKTKQLKRINVFCKAQSEYEDNLNGLMAISHAVKISRDFSSEPGNILHPESYASRIREIFASEKIGVEIEILGPDEMAKLGMNSLLCVGLGSTKKSQLVVMKYNGNADSQDTVAFIGKGVTFDTGGISIKPSQNMHEMKYDMSGSAAVFGAVYALAKRGAKANVIGVVGLVENMPDGHAVKPGDVVKSMSGHTIEVLNTDAEGRLILIDALYYAKTKYNPVCMIDLATLTGALRVALGDVFAGVFSDNDDLVSQLSAAGEKVDEKLWRLPLHEEYAKAMKSDIADIANISSGAGAGSSTAAQFLRKFVGDTKWAHLDIASVAWEGKGRLCHPKGPTAFGVKLLDQFIRDNYEISV